MDDHFEKLSQFRDSILYKETSDESAHHSDPAIRSIWDQVLALCPHHKPPHWESKLCVVILSLIINSSITMNVLGGFSIKIIALFVVMEPKRETSSP